MIGASPTNCSRSAATSRKRGALRTSTSLMPVSPEMNSGICLLGLTRVDHSSSLRRPLNFTAPISIMASRSSLSPVVSISMATMDCIKYMSLSTQAKILRSRQFSFQGKDGFLLSEVEQVYHELNLTSLRSAARRDLPRGRRDLFSGVPVHEPVPKL